MIVDKTESGADARLVNKFPSHKRMIAATKGLRLSEVYLIAAEASYPTDETAALGYLNDLVSQRDPGFAYASIGQALLDDIISERRKELAFEGNR